MKRLACINPFVFLWAMAAPDPGSAPDCEEGALYCWQTTPDGCRFFAEAAIDFDLDDVALDGFACVNGHLDGLGTITVDDMPTEVQHGRMAAGRREGEWRTVAHVEDEGVLVQHGTVEYANGLRHGQTETVAASDYGPVSIAGRFAAGVPTGVWRVGPFGGDAYLRYHMGERTMRVEELDHETGEWEETGSVSKTADGDLVDESGCVAQGP